MQKQLCTTTGGGGGGHDNDYKTEAINQQSTSMYTGMCAKIFNWHTHTLSLSVTVSLSISNLFVGT